MESDVTYYEELGVESTASAEEIRRAYRKLAQLLHPDQHQDEVLRRICERQLARLNGIAEILDDPKQRREYDLGLQGGRVNAARGRSRMGEYLSSVSLAIWVWVAAGVAGMALMALLFLWNAASAGGTLYRAAGHGEEGKAKAQSAAASVAVPNVTVPKREEAGDAAAVRRKAKESPVAGQEDPRTIPAAAQAKGSDSGESVTTAPVPDVPAGEPQRLSEVVPEARRSAPGTAAPGAEEGAKAPQEHAYFAGDWFFSRDVSRRDAALYPPEMIEVAITEENGVLRGKYRGRYRVTDRPISPNVNFEFTGPAGKGETVELGWSGAEGAEGRVRLKAITPVSMEVSWWATRMGALDLTSGTAVLIRAEEK
jgi:curved DNA-binding protein CbpA